jgi:hypothetical protein
MPYKKGPGTYKGYQSPDTGGWPEPIRDEVRRVYGSWRSKHPGEDPKIKARGSRIAWFTAKKKYPRLYRQHVQKVRKETRKEMVEHPWAGQRIAQRIAEDHISPARKHRIADLHATARQQRAYARTARNEAISQKKRAHNLLRQGKPVQAADLKADAKLADNFSKWRRAKAQGYDIEAERISSATGGK